MDATREFIDDLENFSAHEFDCKCGCGTGAMKARFLCMLQAARYHSGIPYRIFSGLRCKDHNKAVGGSPTSSHPLGWATDLQLLNNLDEERGIIVPSLILVGFRRIGINRTTIHVDSDPAKEDRMWHYYK